MHPRRSQPVMPAEWPQTLRHVIRAAQLECPRGHAAALLELTALAISKVPSRGIFDPAVRGEDDLFSAIEAAARNHLELTDARTAWRAALEAAGLDLERRDDIEQAASQVQCVSDTAYFYAGLAFGLAALCVYRTG
jgi:hypothetical protein